MSESSSQGVYAIPAFGGTYTCLFEGRSYTDGGIDIDFSIKYDDETKSKASMSKITLYNLSPDTLAAIKEGTKIQLLAGYRALSGQILEDMVGLVFAGEVTRFETERGRKADVGTTLHLGQGTNVWFKALVNTEWAAGTRATNIVADIIASSGFSVGAIDPTIAFIYKRPWSYNGSSKDALAELARDCGAKVYNEGERIFFVKSGRTVITKIEVPSEHIFESPRTKEKGKIVFKTILRYEARPGTLVKLKSKYLTGEYVVTEVKHVRSGGGKQFYTEWEVKDNGGTDVAGIDDEVDSGSSTD